MNALPEPFAIMLPLLHELSEQRCVGPMLLFLIEPEAVMRARPTLWQEFVDFHSWECGVKRALEEVVKSIKGETK